MSCTEATTDSLPTSAVRQVSLLAQIENKNFLPVTEVQLSLLVRESTASPR
jgi:hypothetical protein